MVPTHSATGLALAYTDPCSGNVAYTTDTIKGIEYAFFPATGGVTSPPTCGHHTTDSAFHVPVNAATGINPFTGVTATFSKGMNAGTIGGASFELRDASNALVPATVTYNGGSRIATLTPSGQLVVQSTYTARIKGGAGGVTDLAGNPLAADYTWSFTTGSVSNSNSAWGGSATPTNPSANDPGPVELGVKFKVDVAGSITGMRFYKGAGNTGTHTGNLWNASGTKLATATFTNETATGWQEVSFQPACASHRRYRLRRLIFCTQRALRV